LMGLSFYFFTTNNELHQYKAKLNRKENAT
jgi:hypothetical protein